MSKSSPFLIWENGGSERLSGLPRVIELASSRTRSELGPIQNRKTGTWKTKFSTKIRLNQNKIIRPSLPLKPPGYSLFPIQESPLRSSSWLFWRYPQFLVPVRCQNAKKAIESIMTLFVKETKMCVCVCFKQWSHILNESYTRTQYRNQVKAKQLSLQEKRQR